MFEEQGRSLVTGFLKKFLRFMGTHIKNIGRSAEQGIMRNASETGKKRVKTLVRKGRDLEYSDIINDKKQLETICKQCKKQGMAFAVKKEKDGGYKILYQRKDSTLVKSAVETVLKDELSGKKKTSLADILKRNKDISQAQNSIKAPIKHREVDAR